ALSDILSTTRMATSNQSSQVGHNGRYRALPLAVFVASVAIASIFQAALPASEDEEIGSDYTTFYEPVGRSVLEGYGLVRNDGALALRYPPGYPLVIAALFGTAHLLGVQERDAMRWFNVISFGMTTLLLYLIARVVWGSVLALIA